jgi:hypothetical protein
VAWDIEIAAEVEEFLLGLTDAEFTSIAKSLDALEQDGPRLGRPFVDTINGSRHNNMKELRSIGGHIRLLFAFDPRRVAVVVVGGDKTDDRHGWYERNVPRADARYDEHLATL